MWGEGCRRGRRGVWGEGVGGGAGVCGERGVGGGDGMYGERDKTFVHLINWFLSTVFYSCVFQLWCI